MNKELLLKVKEQILREPKQFVMESFFTVIAGFDAYDAERDKIPNCGTAACIAGWAIALDTGNSPKEVKNQLYDSGKMEAQEAKRVLDIDLFESDRLFYLDGWPNQFKIAYNAVRTPESQAKVAAERIDYFIATGE